MARADLSTVPAVTPVETRYAVPGWGVGRAVAGAAASSSRTTSRFGPVSDAASDTGADDLVRRFACLPAGRGRGVRRTSVDLGWATPFQRALAEALRAVPRGEVVSYGELAALAGRPGAARAAGAFCAANRFAFLVPCHRVVGANGIGGYGEAGVEVKRRLLALEGVVL